jgi:hypothetical protein
MGLTRELRQTRGGLPSNPSSGGTRGFPAVWFREHALATQNVHGSASIEVDNLPCSLRSIQQWSIRSEPFHMTGGIERETVTGMDQLLLCTCIFIYPSATADEVAAFIVNNGGDIYTHQALYERMKHLELKRKEASSEAYGAFTERNVNRCRWFWTLPPPLGIVGERHRRMLDSDESSFSFEMCEPTKGRAMMHIRVRKPGHYTHGLKVNVLMCIEPGDPMLPANVDGSVQQPRRWVKTSVGIGTTAEVFADFVNEICEDLENNPAPGNVNNWRCFLWDNLAAHLSPLLVQTVEARPSPNHFFIVPRPPYQPKYGPIKYIFCELAGELQKRIQPNWTILHLEHEINDVCAMLGCDGKFDNTFAHCGYPV